MQKKHEVEYRALLDQKTFNYLLTKGKVKSKNKLKSPVIIQDAYFCHKHVKNFSEVEMDKVGSFSLRLRQEISGKKKSISLNTKIIQNFGDHNSWLEHEVDVSSYEEGKKILESIGFKIFFELYKKRYSFKDRGINVCLEDIKDFQPAIEIEILTSEDKTELAKTKLLKYLEDNNISKDLIVKKSVTNLLMKKLAKF